MLQHVFFTPLLALEFVLTEFSKTNSDFSFLFLATMDDLNDSQPRESKYVKKNKEGKYRTTAIRVRSCFFNLTFF